MEAKWIFFFFFLKARASVFSSAFELLRVGFLTLASGKMKLMSFNFTYVLHSKKSVSLSVFLGKNPKLDSLVSFRTIFGDE